MTPGELEEQIRAVIPTATRIEVENIGYSAGMTTVSFSARLKDGSWIVGQWERGL